MTHTLLPRQHSKQSILFYHSSGLFIVLLVGVLADDAAKTPTSNTTSYQTHAALTHASYYTPDFIRHTPSLKSELLILHPSLSASHPPALDLSNIQLSSSYSHNEICNLTQPIYSLMLVRDAPKPFLQSHAYIPPRYT